MELCAQEGSQRPLSVLEPALVLLVSEDRLILKEAAQGEWGSSMTGEWTRRETGVWKSRMPGGEVA